MYTSVITKNKKFPAFIKNHAVFKNNTLIEKIFPEFGLNNFTCKFNNLQGIIPFILKHGVKFSGTVDNELWFRIFEKILGTPFAYLSFIIDYINLKICRSKCKNTNLKIVFSCENKSGAWDIATMSMRGITSCMGWDTNNAHTLVGSIIDPCCGVMYLTDGTKTTYGSKMIYRAVVRYIIHKKVGPCLLLETLYSTSSKPGKDNFINLAFATALHNKTSLPVFYDYRTSYSEVNQCAVIPTTKIIDQHIADASYRDSRINYSKLSLLDVMRFPSLNDFKRLFINWK